jgi:hypothetical protein
MPQGHENRPAGTPRGQQLLAQRALLLLHLYDEMAVGPGSAVTYKDLREQLGLDEETVVPVIEAAEAAGWVDDLGSAMTQRGMRYTAARFWLTGPGLHEAVRLAAQLGDQSAESPKRPLGFRQPGEEEGEM